MEISQQQMKHGDARATNPYLYQCITTKLVIDIFSVILATMQKQVLERTHQAYGKCDGNQRCTVKTTIDNLGHFVTVKPCLQ